MKPRDVLVPVAAVAAAVLLVVAGGYALAGVWAGPPMSGVMEPGMAGAWTGHHGMMGGMMNHGMMGGMMGGQPGAGWACPGMGGWQPGAQRINITQAREAVEAYLASWGGKLALREIMEFEYNFYALVVERDTGIGAFELLVDPFTATIHPEPGPNMMWNTKYGMHGAQGDQASVDMPVTRELAKQYAERWLQQYFGPGVEVEEPTPFYGYYTLDFKVDDRTFGMVSVNGFTGQVWYHMWHGRFIQELEA